MCPCEISLRGGPGVSATKVDGGPPDKVVQGVCLSVAKAEGAFRCGMYAAIRRYRAHCAS